MSDKMKKCPKCDQLDDERKRKARASADNGYGAVPAKEYLALLKEAERSPYLEDTLSESARCCLDGDVFVVNYSCHCNKCNFAFSFSKEISVLK